MHAAGTTGTIDSTADADGTTAVSLIPRLGDRRVFTWRTVALGFFRSRRRSGRRLADAEPMFTDWHHPWLFFLAICIMLLSCLDAYLTLQLLDRGAYEANPVMSWALATDIRMFAWSKMLLTGMGIFVLVFLSRAPFLRFFRTGHVLTSVFALYACLICYEFVYLLATS